MRLLCFPHAGAGAVFFMSWPSYLQPWIDVVCPCLPGRDARAGEQPMTEMTPLVRGIADDIEALLDVPYALYGHSLGSFIAFDLARELARRGRLAPKYLFVSGQRAPSLPYRQTPIFHQADDAFLASVRQRHNALPKSLIADPAMKAFLVRLLRADFKLVEAYRYEAGAPLGCPIMAFGGLDDPAIGRDQLDPWSRETTGRFQVRLIEGAHFFPQTHPTQALAPIRVELETMVSGSHPHEKQNGWKAGLMP